MIPSNGLRWNKIAHIVICYRGRGDRGTIWLDTVWSCCLHIFSTNMDAKKRSHADSTCDSHLIQDDDTENHTASVANDSFPSNTTYWKRCHIDKLGIKSLYRSCAMDVVYEWGLYKLLRKDVVSEELNAIKKIINICNSIRADCTSFEELQTQFKRNHDISNIFIPTENIPGGLGL